MLAVLTTEGCKGKPKHGDTLCVKCKRNAAAYEDVDAENIVINEILWYTEQHRHTASKDAILKVLVCHCSNEDIIAAKNLLIAKYGEHINPERKKTRKVSPNRSDKLKVCEDIYGALFDLDEHNVELLCVALKWSQTIKVAPEEVPDMILAERLVEMEGKFKVFEDALSELKIKQLEMENKQTQPLMSDIVAGRNGPQEPRPTESTSSGPGRGRLHSHARRHSMSATQPSRNNVPNDRDQSNDGFIEPRDQRRRIQRQARREQNTQFRRQNPDQAGQRSRRGPIIGQADGTNGLRATPMPSRDFFVYRVHKDDNEDVLTEHMRSKNVIPRNITIKSHASAKYNSFKVSVAADDVHTVLDAEFWPRGVYVRRWREDKPEEVATTTGDDNQPNGAHASNDTRNVAT